MKQNPNRPICTAVYTRSATDHGLDAQLGCIHAFIEKRRKQGENWSVNHTCVDAERSGMTTDRPGYQKLLRLVRSGKINAVAVARLDRISRFVARFMDLIRKLDGHGVKLVSPVGVREPIKYRRTAEKRRIC